MLIIKDLSERIEDELEDAEKAIKKAIQYKTFDPDVANMFYTISKDEMHHSELLHNQGTRLIKEYIDKNGSIPESMREMYNYLHDRHIEKANQIIAYQGQYQE